MRRGEQYPEQLVRPVAQALVDTARAHPGDVRDGRAHLDDLDAVLNGRPAPSRAAKDRVRRGRIQRAAPMTLTEAATAVMGYLYPTPGSELEAALKTMRDVLLRYVPSGTIPLGPHSASTPKNVN